MQHRGKSCMYVCDERRPAGTHICSASMNAVLAFTCCRTPSASITWFAREKAMVAVPELVGSKACKPSIEPASNLGVSGAAACSVPTVRHCVTYRIAGGHCDWQRLRGVEQRVRHVKRQELPPVREQ